MSRWERLTVSQRFWSKVALPDENGCMMWLASLDPAGYGRTKFQGFMQTSHRVSLWLSDGPPPAGPHQAAHSCRNRHCVAPTHLRWATAAENAADRKRDGTEAEGERHGLSRLKEAEVLEIRRRAALGEPRVSLAQEFNVSTAAIGDVVRRSRWGWLQEESA